MKKAAFKLRKVNSPMKCWKTYKQVGYKKKGGRRVPNCVKNEDLVDQAFLDAKPVNEANIKTIDIWFTDRGRFYRTVIDGKKRVRGWDSWRDAEESLSKLSSFSQEVFTGIKIVKSYAMQDSTAEQFEKISQQIWSLNDCSVQMLQWFLIYAINVNI